MKTNNKSNALTQCLHDWIKKEYVGLSVIAKWEVCSKCLEERNREVENA